MKKYLSIAAGVIAGLAFGLSLDGWQATSNGATQTVAKAKSSGRPVDSRQVEVSPELARRAELKIETVAKKSLAPTLRVVGSINFDANAVAEVGARIEGRVARIMVSVGDVVKQGEPLAEIESAELGSASAELLSARANLIAAEHNEARESRLHKEQLSSAPIVERARAEVNALRAKVHGAEQRLLTMGVSPLEVRRLKAGRGPRHITLRSPLDGQVVTRKAVRGQVVDPTEPILRVANLDRVWVELDVFERDLGHVAVGNMVEIESESYPDKQIRGKVTHVDATVDLSTRTARVRVEVENEQRLLRPGQFVRARLSTDAAKRDVLSVPRTAVLQIEGTPSVFVKVGENRYAAQPVELGVSAGDMSEILRGLVVGDEIVTEGAFALKSELLR